MHEGEKTWDDIARRVANAVSMAEEGYSQSFYSDEFYKAISNMDFIPSTPCLINAGTASQQLSSCFILDIKDSLDSIFEVQRQMAKIFQKNGGVGLNLSALRPAGSPVETAGGRSCGPIGFMEAFDLTADLVTRNNLRKGAIKVDLSDFHPDILDFIKCKDNTTVLTHMNISVALSDRFMEAVKNDDVWELEFPDYSQCKETYNAEWDGDICKWRDNGLPITVYKTLPAKELYTEIMAHAWKTGEPGVSFTDNMNINNPNPHAGKITRSNPCFTGDMRIMTSTGYRRFDEISESDVKIINENSETVEGQVWSNGYKEVIKIIFSNGEFIECTPDHIFKLKDGTECLAKEMYGKKPLRKCVRVPHDITYVKYGYMQGDGDITRMLSEVHSGIEVNIGIKDNEIFQLFESDNYSSYKDGRTIYCKNFKEELMRFGFHLKPLPERDFPLGYYKLALNDKAAFLQGCFSANGSVVCDTRISYKSTCKEFIEHLQQTLYIDFGIVSYITTNKRKSVAFKNGPYECRESYDLNIYRDESIARFSKYIGFYHTYKINALNSLLNKRSVVVKSIQYVGQKEVYDFSEPITHWGIVEGCVVHNCAEFTSIPYNSCLHGDTKIVTLEGVKKISDIVHRSNEILDSDCVFSKPKAVVHKGKKPTFKITLKGGLSLTCTDDHKLYTDKGWKELKQIDVASDKIKILTKYPFADSLYKDKIDKFDSLSGKLISYQDREYESIISIESTNLIEDVYDIVDLEPTNSFYANGMLVHNCNLGSVNLSNMVADGRFDKDKLDKTVDLAVRFLYDMITVNQLPLPEIDKVTKEWRSIGLGTMGLADMLYKLKIPYGSKECLDYLHSLYSDIRLQTQLESQVLSFSRGTYPLWEGSRWQADGIEIRNSNHISIAPTGSISFIANTSGGLEPNFALVYTRRINDGTLFNFINPVFEEVLRDNGLYSDELIQKIIDNNGSCQGIPEIPKEIQDVFVIASDLTPQQHLDVLLAIQQHVDLSSSKTINLPNSATVEDIEDIYLKAWEGKAKGITVYRDASRENQTFTVQPKTTTAPAIHIDDVTIHFDTVSPISKNDLGTTYGPIKKYKVACGNLYINIAHNKTGDLSEIYINTGKGGICQSNVNALSRTISAALRCGIKVEEIIDQLVEINCPACKVAAGNGKKISGLSCPDVIGNALLDEYNSDETIIKPAKRQKKIIQNKTSDALCPDCHASLMAEGGCIMCKNCGWQKCT